jgi:hypothetical protein
MLVSTGAFPLSDGTDTIDGVDIEMSPADGPNGKYVVINEAGEIELVLSSENPYLDGDGIAEDTVAPIDRVFTVTNNGTETTRIWISDDAEDVRFYRGGDPSNSLEGATNEIELVPDETVAVGLLVDTRGDHDVESVSGFTVHAEQGTPTPTPTETETPPTPTPDPTPTTTTTDPTPTPTATETPSTTTPSQTPGTTTPSPPAETTTESPPPDETTTPSPPLETTFQSPTTETSPGERPTATTTTVSGGLNVPEETEMTTAGGNGPTGGTTLPGSTNGDDPGGFPAELGGFDSAGVLSLLALLMLVLLALVAYRRSRSG